MPQSRSAQQSSDRAILSELARACVDQIDFLEAAAEEIEHVAKASLHGAADLEDVDFQTETGSRIRVSLNRKNSLDLFVDGKHKIQDLSAVHLDGNNLHFKGTKLMTRLSHVPLLPEMCDVISRRVVALECGALLRREAMTERSY